MLCAPACSASSRSTTRTAPVASPRRSAATPRTRRPPRSGSHTLRLGTRRTRRELERRQPPPPRPRGRHRLVRARERARRRAALRPHRRPCGGSHPLGESEGGPTGRGSTPPGSGIAAWLGERFRTRFCGTSELRPRPERGVLLLLPLVPFAICGLVPGVKSAAALALVAALVVCAGCGRQVAAVEQRPSVRSSGSASRSTSTRRRTPATSACCFWTSTVRAIRRPSCRASTPARRRRRPPSTSAATCSCTWSAGSGRWSIT